MASTPNSSDIPMPEDPNSLQAQLAKYRQAIEQEFVISENHQEGLDTASITEKTKEMLTHAVPIAVQQIVHLVQFAEKETTQLSAAKYVLDYALGKGKLDSPDDPIADLIKQMGNVPSNNDVK
jgi:hypothetical protein